MTKRFCVTPRALRHYEDLQLLTPQRVGTKRLYSQREVHNLTVILALQKAGIGPTAGAGFINTVDGFHRMVLRPRDLRKLIAVQRDNAATIKAAISLLSDWEQKLANGDTLP